MSFNSLSVGKLKFIVANLKGLSAVQLGAELDRLCVCALEENYHVG